MSARALAVLALCAAQASSARAQDGCREHVTLEPPASEPALSLADLEPEPAPVDDPAPLLQLTHSMASRGLTGAELAAWLHRVVEAHFALERYWARRAHDDLDGERAERERDEARLGGIVQAARLVQGFPDYARLDDVEIELASALERAGQRARAVAVYQRVAERGRDSSASRAQLRLAHIAAAEGDLDAAREGYEAVSAGSVRDVVASAIAVYELAWLERRAQHHARALRLYLRAAAIGPAIVRARALVELAPSFVRARRASGAIGFVQRTTRSDDERAGMASALVAAYVDAGRTADALTLAMRARSASIGDACEWSAVIDGLDGSSD